MAKLKRLVLPLHLPLDMFAPDLLDFGCVGDYDDVYTISPFMGMFIDSRQIFSV